MLFHYVTESGRRIGVNKKRHLGGHIVGGAENTFCDKIWQWALDNFNIKSMIDIGCGEGYAVSWFDDKNCKSVGIEGSEIAIRNSPKPSLLINHDYCDGPFIPKEEFDLAWSCEFVEHVDEKFINNFLITFSSAKKIMMTHAVPNQRGHHHVNCKNSDYWISRFGSIGYKLDKEATDYTRTLMPNTFYGLTGMVFNYEVCM